MYPKPFKAPNPSLVGVATMSLEGREPRKRYRKKEMVSHDTAHIRLLKDKKTVYSLTVKPSKTGKEWTEIDRVHKNPDKINFGFIKKGNDQINFCAYKETSKDDPNIANSNIRDMSKPIRKWNPKSFLIFVNGEWIKLDIDDWRKIFRIMNRIGGYFGLQAKKKRKSKR